MASILGRAYLMARLARLLPDGPLDVTFRPGTNGLSLVRTARIQSDGKILLVGYCDAPASPLVMPLTRLFATNGSPVFAFDRATLLPDQNLHLSISGDSPGRCLLEAAGQVDAQANWLPLTWLTNTLGRMEYIDSAATNFSHRFYRLGWTPGD